MKFKTNSNLRLLTFIALLQLAACAPIGKQEIAELRRPMDCQTAAIDTHLLLRQRANVVERIGNGILCIVPPVVISDLVQGQYEHRVAVFSGHYNELLEHKIAKYFRTCGVRRVARR
jgi:uncharacterized Fe-S center protein